jgi:hypothetical protein
MVMNNADSGSGSLRDVVTGAGDNAVINFNFANQTIYLTSGEIAITAKNLTIEGGSNNITIDGTNNSNDRIFYIN